MLSYSYDSFVKVKESENSRGYQTICILLVSGVFFLDCSPTPSPLAIAEKDASQAVEFYRQGKNDEAESLLWRAMETTGYLLGNDHPLTLAIKENLRRLGK